ncbi:MULTISPECIES: RNA polymerase sigma factor [Clostridium]|uniref:Sigma-70 family RNA polymerase sigma factor n=1 Tax=Clostridium tertium TaxID=1559 RepID=A0A9X3XLL7_9CLOT|nr:sigma-70 family RNA polymerase sigma factor [Clostridium tertium]EEH98905.2 sigma-70 family RNA polymerase sigma factor [Clostridium sp. 7_2_43FAA]MDC4241428.1 sigma-70 family RNA polymerase sigma factor [Clostridium tertium]MDU8966585.1 sigma-70 family RNA polymerase sigma factor [Clostridium sp.]
MNMSNIIPIGVFNKYKDGKLKKNNVRLAIDGDKEAFNILVQENLKSLYIVARGMLNSEYDIEDAFQNTILKAYEKISGLKNEEFFKTWLTRILINECNNIIRKNKKVTYIEDSQINNEVYEDKYKNIDLIRAIDSLSSDLRITMWLFYFDDMSIEEISNALKIPKGTIKSRLNRGREKIYNIMSEGDNHE